MRNSNPKKLGYVILNFVKNLSNVVAIGAVIFGGAVAAFIAIEDLILEYPIMRYLSVSLWFLIFALLGFVYKQFKQYREETRKRDIEYSSAASALVQDLGFRSKVESEELINIDGSKVAKRHVEIEVTKGELSAREHRFWIWGDAAVSEYEIDVFGDGDGSRITWKTVQRGPQGSNTIVEFSPPLEVGQKPKYTIVEKFGPGTYAMTQDEVLQYIKANKWITDEPYVAKVYLISFPTTQFISRVILPKEFPITGREFWDVKIGEGDSRAHDEFERLKREGCFTMRVIGNLLILELTVMNPQIGLSYWIKWKPPFREEYERLIA